VVHKYALIWPNSMCPYFKERNCIWWSADNRRGNYAVLQNKQKICRWADGHVLVVVRSQQWSVHLECHW